MDSDIDPNKQFRHLDYILARKSPFAHQDFQPDEGLKQILFQGARVLVVGAGGLGCQILKDLALSGFHDIEVIDMDTIDVTNLNRQFLFRSYDVGKYKAEVAAKFIMERCKGVKVKAHTCKIQDFPPSFYQDFHIIIAGLDNIQARRWLNFILHRLVKFDQNGVPDPTTTRPLIDGGTEGFRGQARVILPYSPQSACFECTLSTLPKQKTYPMCTIAQTPRLPQHCIQYAYVIQWQKQFGPDKHVNKDSIDDMKWIYQKALKRAESYGIEGVTYSLTMGVVKNIIPAIASTNALISAACCNQALKLGTYCAKSLDNYMMYMGQDGVFVNTMKIEKDPQCMVCSSQVKKMQIDESLTLRAFLQQLKGEMNLFEPQISCEKQGLLYIPRPPMLEEAHRFKLDKTWKALIQQKHVAGDQGQYEILDKTLPAPLRLIIKVNEVIDI